MKRASFLLALSVSFLFFDFASAQKIAPQGICDLPVFQALVGKRIENGTLVPSATASPIGGSATSVGQSALAGQWFQLDGTAAFGPVKWGYRWMFRLREKDKVRIVEAIYLDTIGQRISYEGLNDAAENRVQLIANLPDGGVARSQFTLGENGTVAVESVIFDPKENPAVRYSATSTRAE